MGNLTDAPPSEARARPITGWVTNTDLQIEGLELGVELSIGYRPYPAHGRDRFGVGLALRLVLLFAALPSSNPVPGVGLPLLSTQLSSRLNGLALYLGP